MHSGPLKYFGAPWAAPAISPDSPTRTIPGALRGFAGVRGSERLHGAGWQHA